MRFVQLSDVPQRIKMPAHWVFKPEDAFSPLWKATLGDVDEPVIRAMSMAWPKLGRQELRAKLATALSTGGSDAVARLARAHRDRLAARWKGMPRLPAARLAVLLAEADVAGAELSKSLGRLHAGLTGGGYGVQMLQQLAVQLDVADEAAGSAKRQGAEAGLRGKRHEEAVLRWVSEQWPGPTNRVLGPCFLVSPARELGGAVRGVKQEFDAVVLAQPVAPGPSSQHAVSVRASPQQRHSGSGGGDGGSEANVISDLPDTWGGGASASGGDCGVPAATGVATVVTLVEAKAGRELFEDLPKLLAARSLFEATRASPAAGACTGGGSGKGAEPGREASASGCGSHGEDPHGHTAHVERREGWGEAVLHAAGAPASPLLQLQVGKAGGLRVPVRPAEAVHLVYVFGAATTSLDKIARGSALAAEAGVMLRRHLELAASEMAAAGAAGGVARSLREEGVSDQCAVEATEELLAAALGLKTKLSSGVSPGEAEREGCGVRGGSLAGMHGVEAERAADGSQTDDLAGEATACHPAASLDASPLDAAPFCASPLDERHVWGARVVAGGLHVEFRRPVQAAGQSSVDAFVETLTALVQSRRASFWAQVPLGGEEAE